MSPVFCADLFGSVQEAKKKASGLQLVEHIEHGQHSGNCAAAALFLLRVRSGQILRRQKWKKVTHVPRKAGGKDMLSCFQANGQRFCV